MGINEMPSERQDPELLPTATDISEDLNIKRSIPSSIEVCDAAKSSFSFYAQLMRHDWHSRVHHRNRQRGWTS